MPLEKYGLRTTDAFKPGILKADKPTTCQALFSGDSILSNDLNLKLN
jgi:hypothetical protein